MKIKAVGRTDVGMSRPQNEDAFMVDERHGLYLVCDGMGGHKCGAIASAYAIEKMSAYIKDNRKRLKEFLDEDSDTPDSVIIAFIEDAIRFVADAVLEYAQVHDECDEMGTTLTALLVFGERAVLGHVGDSRCYMIRGGNSAQLTDDHTVVAKLVQRGVITREAARDHQFRHVLSQSIGSEKPLHIDTLLFDVQAGDVYILCSDGLIDYLEQEEVQIEDVVAGKDLTAAVDALIDFANVKGGKDNITVVAVQALSSY